MPFFSFAIDTPKNTAKKDAKVTELELCPGVIRECSVRNHRGARGVSHLQLFHGLYQFAPVEHDADFHGDGIYEHWTDFRILSEHDVMLTAKTWNVSTLYAHEFIVSFSVLPIWAVIPSLYEVPATPTELGAMGEWKEL